MNVKFENYVRTTLASDLDSADITLSVASVSGWPAISSGEWFYLVLVRLSDNKKEVVKVLSYSGTSATIQRGRDGTTALDFLKYDRVEQWVTAGALDDAFSEIETDVDSAQSTADSAETIAADALADASEASTAAAAAQATADGALSRNDGGTISGDVVFSGEIQFTNDVVFSGALDFSGASVVGLTAVPTGTPLPFPVETVPEGYLELNGDSVEKTVYPDLYAFLKDGRASCIYGETATEFTLPDYRGLFLRGWDHGAGIDPEADSRTDRGDTLSGDHAGTKQEDEFGTHHHGIYGHKDSSGPVKRMGPRPRSYGDGETYDTNDSGGTETRPKNINVMWCIKT